MQCQLFLSHLFYLIFRGTRCRNIMGRYLQFFFAGRGGDGGVCVCVLRGVVSWSDLVVMVDLVRSALRNFGQCGSERPTSCASLWHGLLSDDNSFNRKFWQKLPNPFSKKGTILDPPCPANIWATLLLTRPCWREKPYTPRCFWPNLVRLRNPHLCPVTTSDNLQCDNQ